MTENIKEITSKESQTLNVLLNKTYFTVRDFTVYRKP